MNRNRIVARGSDRIFYFINTAYLILCFVVVTLPLLNVVSQSFSSPASVVSGKVLLWPVEPTLVGYQHLFSDQSLMTGFGNSIFYVVFGTTISVVLTIITAYPLSRKVLAGRKYIMWIFVFTMLFNGGLIPTYLLVRNLGMYDTRWALLIPDALIVYNMIIARTFFMNTIPEELYDASTIDGSNDLQTFFVIILPLSTPIIAVMTLFYAVGIWNTYFNALIYLSDSKLFPLQLVLRNILINSQLTALLASSNLTDKSQQLAFTEVLKYAIIVAASVPVLILYPFIQKYFRKGIMIGSVKG